MWVVYFSIDGKYMYTLADNIMIGDTSWIYLPGTLNLED